MEMEPLHLVAREAAQKRLLIGGLDAFGDHGHTKGPAEREDGFGNRQVLRISWGYL